MLGAVVVVMVVGVVSFSAQCVAVEGEVWFGCGVRVLVWRWACMVVSCSDVVSVVVSLATVEVE